MVRSSNVSRTRKFRIFALYDELGPASASQDDLLNEQVLVDELRNVASPGDVIVGINASGNSRSVLRAFQYAKEIGCRTICIAGKGGGKLAAISDTAVLVPASLPANVDDTHMIVCRMIGHYFVNFDQE
jgi:D-sedoheptulose 7-phosphate isomerase